MKSTIITLVLFLITTVTFCQLYEKPEKELIIKNHIKSITTWLIRDTTNKRERYYFWKFDKNGNVISELFYNSNTNYDYIKYFYNSQGLLIECKETGDFLCFNLEKSHRKKTHTYYKYNENGQLIIENKIGGCCKINTSYIYEGNLLRKKIFDNIGLCKYTGEVGEIEYFYDQHNYLTSKKYTEENYSYLYAYNDKHQNISEKYCLKGDTSLLSNYEYYTYDGNRIIKEIEGFPVIGEKNHWHEIVYYYSYDNNGLLTEIKALRMDNSSFTIKYFYKYE